MRKVLVLFTLLFTSLFVNSQVLDPVQFTTSVEKISESDYYLVIETEIEAGWHLYAQEVPEDGPIPTTIYIKGSEDTFQVLGKPSEPKGHTEFDKTFEMDIKYFENTATFKQKIRLLTNEKIDINGEIEYMVCDDKQCLPPTFKDINFSLQGTAGIAATASEILNVTEEKKSEVVATTPSNKPESSSKRGLWTIFFIAFFSGFAALLTPCVFPMIPMTVSFFYKTK